MKKILLAAVTIAATATAHADVTGGEEKNAEDPTKIITRVGAGWTNSGIRFNGSLGLDEARMINVSITDDGDEWSVGGSWLFDIGILNVDVRKSDFGDGNINTSYSAGTYLPLESQPWGWMPFVTFGYSYNDGETTEDGVKEKVRSHAGYLGMFAIKPINEKWTGIAVVGTTQGQNNYSSYWGGAGISHQLTQSQSINLVGIAVDSSLYGSDQRLNLNYRYEFK
ncbi:hypothetical protein BIZ37_00870 [Photobacterium sp. BZF1]|uniref:hypothetical protein n=1 Tax=Photobacterium sp. BZF1 TaxID=1904457 RepID=UPI00165367A9|nr:hypothetical protein [Photobacterium sp. BZF1]MBC7001092.1 hypothetical protein [Photobacterium sp. BZF1]